MLKFVLPSIVVTVFPNTCLGMTLIKPQYDINKCALLSPDEFMSLHNIQQNHVVVLWMVDTSRRLKVVVEHWFKIQSNATCLVVTRSTEDVAKPNHVVALIKKGEQMINMRTGRLCKLSHTLQVRKLIVPIEHF